MPAPTLTDLLEAGVAGRTVLIRSDLNVPLDGDTVTDDGRIRASLPAIRDLAEAGARVIVSFARDVYRVFRQFTQQPDIRVLEVEDYISRPKPSGYRSLHCLVQVPIHLSTGTIPVTVEMQFRTSAMDLSLIHI